MPLYLVMTKIDLLHGFEARMTVTATSSCRC
ncbi:hypothetical protein [Xenorhabdus bovienii]